MQMMAEWITLPLWTMQTNLSLVQFQIFFTTHWYYIDVSNL